jgi:hypothetical protein
MASPKPSVLKRQRERKRAEKAALKREQRAQRSQRGGDGDAGGTGVATSDELAGYGVGPAPGEGDARRGR